MSKLRYLTRSAANFFSGKRCPYCGGPGSKVVDRKYIVTTLNACATCRLLYRHPTDSVAFNSKFYQSDYEQHDGMTTDLPGNEDLQRMAENNFAGTRRDFNQKIHLLKELAGTERPAVVDYGANWGYTSYQFKNAGFSVQSYEISKPRAAFGKRLGVDIVTDAGALREGVDLFFNSHVIEHLPDIKAMFLLAQRLLKPHGLFAAYCPNGSGVLQESNPVLFRNFWGEVHPNCLSAEFFSHAFKDVPYLIGSDAADESGVRLWDQQSQQVLDLTGNELFVFAKLKAQSFGA